MSNLLVQNIKHTNGTTAATVDSSGVFASTGHVIQVVEKINKKPNIKILTSTVLGI